MDALELLPRILVAGFGLILTFVSLRSWMRYRELRFVFVTLAFAIFAVEGLVATYDSLTPGDILLLPDALILGSLAQLLLLYLAVVRR